MARSYVETFFRHRYVLMLPVILGFVAGAAFGFTVPRQYTVGASFWADTGIEQDSTIGTTGGNAPPSAGQVALMTQLLNTRAFLRSVVEISPLAEEFRTADPLEADRLLWRVAASVVVASPGPQLVTLSVTGEDPEEAKALASAVLEQYERAGMEQILARAKARKAYDERQLESARQALESSDSEAVQQAYADAVAAYQASTLAVQNAESSGLQIADHPDLATPHARRKTIIMGAAGGLLAGMTLSILALLALMARDKSLRGEEQTRAALGLDVVGSVPHLDGLRRHSRAPKQSASLAGVEP